MKQYEKPLMQIMCLEKADIICTSNPDENEGPGDINGLSRMGGWAE